MVLLIDAGNTRIKWAIVDSAVKSSLGHWLREGSMLHAELSEERAPWNGQKIQRVLMSNVAGEAVQERLLRTLQLHSVTVERVISKASLANIKNHYQQPDQLGSDRFAAAIGAHALFPNQDLLIATCGTATTIDAVSAQGDFIGGMIAPGLLLMADSLAKNTGQLPHVQNMAHGKKASFAVETTSAILSGCLAAQAGAIEFAVKQFSETTQVNLTKGQPLCILSGGAAPYIQSSLRVSHRLIENLVLIGLQVISQ